MRSHDCRQVVDGGEYVLMTSVICNSTPVDATERTGREDRTAGVRRSENAFVAILGNQAATAAAVPECNTPGIGRLQSVMLNKRWCCRKWLRRRRLLARYRALRHG